MLPKFFRVLWGDLSRDEIKKFGILAATFFLIIGTYWMLRVLKNPLFSHFIGFKWQPVAKLVSLVFVGVAVLIYSKLVDLFEKHVLFYIICSFYGLGFITTAYLMTNPQITAAGTTGLSAILLGWIPGNIIGWFSYIFLESFGSIVPALFWAFVASSTSTESAKRGYGMIMSLTQLGTILGPWVVTQYSASLGLPMIFGIGGLIILLVPFMIMFYMAINPNNAVSIAAEKLIPKTGFFEGLRLLFTKPYLGGVLVIATMYEVIGTIIEFQMNILAEKNYPTQLDGGAAFAWFDGTFGMSVGFLTLLFALFGTSFFIRKFGLKFCLMTFPITIGIVMFSIFMAYTFGVSSIQLMWISFAAMVLTKGLNYALNIPTKEVLYIPTSKDVKFKAKGWIDAFGNRTSKALGVGITGPLGGSLPLLLFYGTIASLGIVSFWVFVAIYVGNSFDKLQRENKIIQ
jgi:AAA family ATP:ADP antiporter